MSRTQKVLDILPHRTALRFPTSFQSNNGSSFGLCFTSATFNLSAQEFSTVKEQGVGLGEKAKERVKNAVEAAKDAAQNIKDKVAGKAAAGDHGNSSSQQQEQPTDSSVEDLRNRPGGYS